MRPLPLLAVLVAVAAGVVILLGRQDPADGPGDPDPVTPTGTTLEADDAADAADARPGGPARVSLPDPDAEDRDPEPTPGQDADGEPASSGTPAAPFAGDPATLAELRAVASEGEGAPRVQRLGERLPQAAADLGLSSDQAAELERLVLDAYVREARLDELWETTQDSAAVSARYDDDQAAFREGLAALLTEQQLEAYRKLDAYAFPGASGRGR